MLDSSVTAEKVQTWAEKTAEHLSNLSHESPLKAEFILSTLEAAGEIKAVRLKILLARAYEVLRECHVDQASTVEIDDDLITDIGKEIEA